MANSLSAFFAQNAKKVDNQFVIASPRFVDQNNEPVRWEICCITADENVRLRKECMRSVPVPGRRGQYTQEFDAMAYQSKIAARCTVYPNLNDAELQASYGVNGAEKLITTMLSAGEFEDYSAKVLGLNGFSATEELVDEAKN